ncbi:MAG: hypothetical protein KatS3mg120_2051 [Erythrobacter sp.]|nr:MAG: hypothetical protein KatS3mg120_2051 [Erythrobacter sp.]
MTFADLGLSPELLKAVEDAGYTAPTPIQAQAIPTVLMMKDLIGIAQTGTGKTASFVLPMIDILASGRRRRIDAALPDPRADPRARRPGGRKLREIRQVPRLKMALLIGGVGWAIRSRRWMKGVDVLIATPGRLLDWFERGKILLNGARCS